MPTTRIRRRTLPRWRKLSLMPKRKHQEPHPLETDPISEEEFTEAARKILLTVPKEWAKYENKRSSPKQLETKWKI